MDTNKLQIATQLQNLVQSESSAINEYLAFLQLNVMDLPAEVIGKIREIISDEKEHLESLNEIAKLFDNIEAKED